MMLRKCIRPILYLAVLLMALSPTSGAAQSPDILRVGLLSTPENVDPALAWDDVSFLLIDQLFLGLVEVDEEGQVHPELAEAWEASEDGLVWTFNLRPGIVWVDAYGDRQADVNAYDVINSMYRALEIGVAAGDLQIIESLEAIDDYTVRFYLSEPAGYFPAILSLPVARPVPIEIADAYGLEAWTTPGNIWNNGPYLLIQWDGEFIQLKRNPHWPGADEVHFEEVQITTGLNAQEALERYQDGEFDLIELNEDVYAQVLGDAALASELHTLPDAQTTYFGFITTKPPFDDLRARQAFAQTVDREKLCELLGWGTPTARFVPPGVFGSTSNLGLDFNPDQAQQLLAEAGYPQGEGFPAVSLFYTTEFGNYGQMVEAAAADWGRYLGVEVEPVDLPEQAYWEAIHPDTPEDYAPEIFHLSYRSLLPDAYHWLFYQFNSSEGANLIRWSNGAFDELTYASRYAPDPDQRAGYYAEAEFILLEQETGIIPVCHSTRAYIAKPYVEPRFSIMFGLGPFHEWQVSEGAIGPPPETGFLIPRTTKVMDDETFDALVSISEDQAVFTFARMTDQLAALLPGDILVGDQVRRDLAPFGFLRRVNNTYTSGDQVIVETDQATLDEAIELGELDFSLDLELENVLSSRLRSGVSVAKVDTSPLREGFSLKIDEVLIDDDGDPDTTYDQIRARGNINLDPDVDLRLRIKDHELKYLEYSHTTSERAQLDLVTGINIIDVHPRVEIAHYVFMPQTIWIGWVPVVITPEMSVYVGMDGNVSVGITTGIEQDATFKTGVIYEGGNWTPFEDFANEFGYTPPTLEENCSAKAYLGPEISLMLYGVTGPYGRLQGYLRLVANPGDVPWWELYAGVGANIGVKVKVLSHVVASYEETIIDYEELLTQADTEAAATAPEPDSEQHDEDDQGCTSRWWPPKCWRWWVWVILIVIVLFIIASLL
jgi:oligopeptide transport system substrate-binding protein